MKILFSNLGYAKGIGGSLAQHLALAGRHVYAPPAAQQEVLAQFRAIIDREKPDLCCMVEIDSGSFTSGYFNQIEALKCRAYCYHDIAGKYGEQRVFSYLPPYQGRCNAFIANREYAFRRRYFMHGRKRLAHEIRLQPGLTLFFAHFSLRRRARALQFQEMRAWVQKCPGDALILADFNILRGAGELEPLLADGALRLLNRMDEPTFTFHRRRLALDLCLCSVPLAPRVALRVIPQPFSDHAALLVELHGG